MKIDITKLKCVHTASRGGQQVTIAQCPACQEEGHDTKGNHLIVYPDGRYGCVVNPVEDNDSHLHRKRIFALVGLPLHQPPRRSDFIPKTAMPSATATVRVVKLKSASTD